MSFKTSYQGGYKEAYTRRPISCIQPMLSLDAEMAAGKTIFLTDTTVLFVMYSAASFAGLLLN
jgi:hypothetical protein